MFGLLQRGPLKVGTPAPDFTLPDQDGKIVTLSLLKGKNVILVFYPGDDTMRCTRQLCDLRDDWRTVQAKDALVFGINGQGAVSHQDFKKKYEFPFPLLVDESFEVCRKYKTKRLMVRRTVYLIGKDGTIRFSKRGMPSPSEILAAAQ